jgi:quercetin dioxygenase-like cupin family protein
MFEEPREPTHADWLDVFGPRIKTLSKEQDGSANGYAVFLGIIPAGVVVPLHSHEDRETMYVLAGAVEVFTRGEWHSVSPNGVVDINSNEPHAWRNVTDNDVTLIIVTTSKIERFFAEIGRPISASLGPPTPQDMERLMSASDQYGYWVASPEENFAIGLQLP